MWQRIATTSALMAPLGWAAGRFAGVGPVVVGTSAGALVAAFGLRPQKVALGPLVGAAVGLAARRRRVPTAAVAATAVLAYRLLSAQLFRDAQGVCWPSGYEPRICPSSCRWRRVPATSARPTSGPWPRCSAAPTTLTRADVGIVATLDELAGPEFDPGAVDRRVREFYEHTTRFSIDIVPPVRPRPRWVRAVSMPWWRSTWRMVRPRSLT